MKKIISILLTIMIMMSAVSASASETWYVSARSGLNCRACPTTDAPVLKVYTRGAALEIIGVDSTGVWWETWDGVTQGWVHSA